MEVSLGTEIIFLIFFCPTCCLSVGTEDKIGNTLRLVYQWKKLEFQFPTDKDRKRAIEKRFYVPGVSVPVDVDVQHRKGDFKSRVFVTIPRFDEGRPITLGTINENGSIVAYPDYSWHDNQGKNCDGMTSVFRIAIDKCNRLWAMDTGRITEQRCEPQILSFSLTRDQLVHRHRIAKKNYADLSLFVTPVVDIRQSANGECSDTFVYVADVTGFAIVVIDIGKNRSWRATHRLFYPHPPHGSFNIDNEKFDLMEGIVGMALSPKSSTGDDDQYLYFHALASVTENYVLTSVLRNSSVMKNSELDPSAVKELRGKRKTQSAAQAMDRNGVLFFGSMKPSAIYCWNRRTKFLSSNIEMIAVDNKALQFASGVKIVDNLKGEQELWVLTSSFQRVMTGSLNVSRVNFRIHAEKIHAVIKDTVCTNNKSLHIHGEPIHEVDFVVN